MDKFSLGIAAVLGLIAVIFRLKLNWLQGKEDIAKLDTDLNPLQQALKEHQDEVKQAESCFDSSQKAYEDAKAKAKKPTDAQFSSWRGSDRGDH